MQIKRIQLNNFMSYNNAEIDCSIFDSALVVGTCKNNFEESNGVGKTSLFYAIEYALFGTAPSKTIDKIIRDDQDLCTVSIDIENDGEDFRIERSRSRNSKKSNLKLYQKINDKWKNISQRTPTETQTDIAKRIKINNIAFRYSVLFSQSDLDGLPSGSPEKRREILNNAVSLEIYKKLEKKAKQELKEVSDKIDSFSAVINSLGNPQEDIQSFEKEKSHILLKIKDLELIRENLDINLKNKNKELNDLQKLLNSSSSDLFEKLNNIKALQSGLKNSIAKLQKNNIEIKSKLDKQESLINNNKSSIISTNLKIDNLNTKNVRKEDDISLDLVKIKEIEVKGILYIDKIKNKLKELDTPFPDGDKCPYCRQDLSNEHKEDCLNRIRDEKFTLNNKLKEANIKFSGVIKKKTELELEFKQSKDYGVETRSLNDKKQSLEKEVLQQEEIFAQLSDLLKSNSDDLNSKLAELKQEDERYERVLQSISQQNNEETNKQIVIVEKDIIELQKQFNNTINELLAHNSILGRIGEKIESRNVDLSKLNNFISSKKQLFEEKNIIQKSVDAFSSSGIPSMITKTVLDDLQNETNKLLADLRPGLEIQFVIKKDDVDGNSEDVLDIVFRIKGKEREYALISGGQKFIFAVSMKMALALILQRKLGVDIKFLALDEVDQALDKSAVNAYADVIRKWKNMFKIFVITHNDKLKDKFKYTILVENDETNGTTARLVSN